MSSKQPISSSQLDYAAYAAIPNDGQRHEIIRGDHFVNPAPNLYHQQISRRIQFQLYTIIELQELGVVINAPVDLQLSEHDIVQPDLVVVTGPRRHILTPTKIKGIPDLVVEILSPSNPEHDLIVKRELYQRSGLPEYWIVVPDEHNIVQLVLANGLYTQRIQTELITMASSPYVTVDLKKVR